MVHYRAINHDRKFIAFFSPKCGSTTIKNWFQASLNEDEMVTPQTFSKALVASNKVNHYDYRKILFIRDPLDRLVSFYCNFVIRDQKHWCFVDEARDIELEERTFSEFIHLLKTLVDEGGQPQHHLKRQIAGIEGETFDHVYCIENFHHHVTDLNKLLAIDVDKMARYNSTPYTRERLAGAFDLKPSRLKKLGIPDRQSFWNDELIAITTKIYELDVDLHERASSNDPVSVATGKKAESGSASSTRDHPKAHLPKIRLIDSTTSQWRSPRNTMPEPRLFDWVTTTAESTHSTSVYIDLGILDALQNPISGGQKAIAWLASSPAVISRLGLDTFIANNLNQLTTTFSLILTSDRRLTERHPSFRYHPARNSTSQVPVFDRYMHEKPNLCSYLATPNAMYESLPPGFLTADPDKLNVYHSNSNRIEFPFDDDRPAEPRSFGDRLSGIAPYMFNLAVEDSQVPLHYTNILTDCFATGAVPVYRGCDEISEIFDERGVLRMDDGLRFEDLNQDLYDSLEPYRLNNLQIARNQETADDLLYLRYLQE